MSPRSPDFLIPRELEIKKCDHETKRKRDEGILTVEKELGVKLWMDDETGKSSNYTGVGIKLAGWGVTDCRVELSSLSDKDSGGFKAGNLDG